MPLMWSFSRRSGHPDALGSRSDIFPTSTSCMDSKWRLLWLILVSVSMFLSIILEQRQILQFFRTGQVLIVKCWWNQTKSSWLKTVEKGARILQTSGLSWRTRDIRDQLPFFEWFIQKNRLPTARYRSMIVRGTRECLRIEFSWRIFLVVFPHYGMFPGVPTSGAIRCTTRLQESLLHLPIFMCRSCHPIAGDGEYYKAALAKYYSQGQEALTARASAQATYRRRRAARLNIERTSIRNRTPARAPRPSRQPSFQ